MSPNLDDDDDATSSDFIHSHCRSCYSFALCTRDADACEFVRCDYDGVRGAGGCGAVFHACKAPEHELLCQEARVECINSQHGCVAVVLRSGTK